MSLLSGRLTCDQKNRVVANEIKTDTNSVNISSTGPTTTGQSLISTSTTECSWQSPAPTTQLATNSTAITLGLTPPTTGQVLTATSATDTTWQTPYSESSGTMTYVTAPSAGRSTAWSITKIGRTVTLRIELIPTATATSTAYLISAVFIPVEMRPADNLTIPVYGVANIFGIQLAEIHPAGDMLYAKGDGNAFVNGQGYAITPSTYTWYV